MFKMQTENRDVSPTSFGISATLATITTTSREEHRQLLTHTFAREALVSRYIGLLGLPGPANFIASRDVRLIAVAGVGSVRVQANGLAHCHPRLCASLGTLGSLHSSCSRRIWRRRAPIPPQNTQRSAPSAICLKFTLTIPLVCLIIY